MKKLLTIAALLLVGMTSVYAQAQNSPVDAQQGPTLYQPGVKNQMRDFQNVLALDRVQMQEMKTYFTTSMRDERETLATLTGTFQRENAKMEFRNDRDAFVRALLTEAQIPVFDEYVLNRAQQAPAPGGTVGSGLGGGN